MHNKDRQWQLIADHLNTLGCQWLSSPFKVLKGPTRNCVQVQQTSQIVWKKFKDTSKYKWGTPTTTKDLAEPVLFSFISRWTLIVSSSVSSTSGTNRVILLTGKLPVLSSDWLSLCKVPDYKRGALCSGIRQTLQATGWIVLPSQEIRLIVWKEKVRKTSGLNTSLLYLASCVF